MDGVRSIYPGGPGHRSSGQGGTSRSRRPAPGERFERRKAKIVVFRQVERRRRNLRLVIGVGVALACLLGYSVVPAVRSPQDVVRAEGQNDTVSTLLKKERRIILGELWKMEALESMRR